MPREAFDEAGPALAAARRRLGLLEAIDHVSQIDGPVMLILLICPSLNSNLVQVLLFEGVQKCVYLLLDLIRALMILP